MLISGPLDAGYSDISFQSTGILKTEYCVEYRFCRLKRKCHCLGRCWVVLCVKRAGCTTGLNDIISGIGQVDYNFSASSEPVGESERLLQSCQDFPTG